MHRIQLQHIGSMCDAHGNRLVELYYAPTRELLHVEWFGNITGREVIYVAQEFLKVQKQLNISVLLNDKSHATGDWTESMEWLEFDWLPQVLLEGLRAVAYVFSPDAGTHYASRDFSERVARHIPIRLFYDVPSASKWLNSQVRFNPNTGHGFAAQA
ncbi:hypothetical protein [Hymenobacter wooponensis]|uniref:STAS/SEC14 domain-containing protein n=1 Tax=Hymenobacter wooponensis TaxID=1525360 RepID=A0A4Z0MU14_9BACT|nr:hypothetical protein [Hymenobacter wooponensis]TGD82816.1 hypothetical protein EU557_03270 [Hymenobacter wooponensis]